MMVLYISKWRDANNGNSKPQTKAILFTCRSGSSSMGDEVHDWRRQSRCCVSHRLFRFGEDGVFPNRMSDLLSVFGEIAE
ncbi:hypothetical protein AtEden1_Chr5g0108841 [Arabidopsis thaliana]